MKLKALVVAAALALPIAAYAQSTGFPPAGSIAVGPAAGQKGWKGIAPGSTNDCVLSNGTAWVSGSCPSSGGGPPSGAAGGGLTGTYPNPTIANNAVSTAAITDANVTAAKLAAAAASTNLGVISIKDYTAGGTSNDTTGVQSAFTACGSAGGCWLVCQSGVTYTVDAITVSTGTMLVGKCIFQQRTSSSRILSLSSVNNILIEGPKFQATSPTINTVSLVLISGGTNVTIQNSYFLGSATVDIGLSAPTGGADAIQIGSTSSNIKILSNTFYRFNFRGIYAAASSDVNFSNNQFLSVPYPIRLQGVTLFTVGGNILDTSILYSTSPNSNQFSVGIALESTDGHSDGISYRGTITGNTIRRFGWSQGVLIHAGAYVTIGNNTCEETGICISLNPFNSTDTLSYMTINGNQSNGTTGVSSIPAGSGDPGIVIKSGASPLPEITQVSVTGNVISSHNRVVQDAGAGCVNIGYAQLITVVGNTFNGCGGSAVVIDTPVNGVIMSSNMIANTITASGQNNGIYFTSAASAARVNAIGNFFRDMTNGYKYATGITVTNIQTLSTLCISVTNCTSGP